MAGAVPGIDLFALTDEQWDGGLALKFHGARRLTVRAWDALKASRDGVQVKCVSPGAVMTPRRLAMLEKAAAAAGLDLEEVQQRFLAQSGIKRFGQPDELADLIAFALSPRAPWMTGTVLRMDGGEIKSI